MNAAAVPTQLHERERYRRQCEGKIRHTDPAAAALAAWKMEQRNRWPYQIYTCRYCGGLHVGGASPFEQDEDGR